MKIPFALTAGAVFAVATQALSQDLPSISASTRLLDIRDGDDFYQQAWRVSPDYKPDTYASSKIGEWVTFYTDQDSISYQVHPDSVYDFVILLDNGDSAFTQIKYKPTHLEILKKASAFDTTDPFAIPTFTYQDSSAYELRTLRKELALDSIAGGGNEVSKIIHLMHWVHDLIPHDGQSSNPVVKNALSMIGQCKDEGRGLNCRGLATVLNECYLAMGMKSRIVTCMPKDSIYDDCHVINMVYSNQLDKWVWVDPTNDAYVMDENGELLGFGEVRERLIQGRTLILNPDANWNHMLSTEKEFYLFEYMAKNLYRFSSPLHSEYDYETFEKGEVREYVELIPVDGYNQTPKYSEMSLGNTGVLFKTYKTNNPEAFWAKPE